MSSHFCNVALPVPLRRTFTYAVPEALRASLQAGSRVLVPFRKKSVVGVVVEFVDSAPAVSKVREITKVLDFVPALTPKLIELAQWVANYYLAPIGEVSRSMLPPITELKSQRQIVLTEAGREFASGATGAKQATGLTLFESAFLAKLSNKNGVLPFASASKSGVDAAGLQKLQRLGLVEIREVVKGRERKKQQVIAWKSSSCGDSGQRTFSELEDKIRALLEIERGPLPLAQLLRLAQVSRSAIARMLRVGLLESWEETIDPAEDPFDSGYTPPAHELNAEQERAMKEIRALFELGEFSVRLLYGVTGSVKTEV